MQENFKEAKPLYEKCIALRRVADDPDWLAGSLNNLANVEQELGDFDSAAVLHGEALAIRRSLGSIQGLAQSLQNLGSLSKARGQFETSLDYFEESLTMFHSLRDTRSVGQVLDGLAGLYYALGNRPFAVKLWSASKAVRITAGTYPGGAAQMRMESFWGGVEQEMGAEEFQSAWADGSHLDLDGAFKLAFSRA
jgi:tetratricopeptide (TPR) repeat protein